MLNLKMLSDGVGIKMLGVHEGRPVPPVYTTCRRGMKHFDRFFYVKSGVINFDLPDGGGLSAGAGDIIYLPCDCEYISHWDIMEGGFISMNFIVGGNPASKPLGDRIEIAAHDRSGKYLAWFERAEEIFMRSDFGYIYDCTAIFFGIIKQVAADSAADTLKARNGDLAQAAAELGGNLDGQRWIIPLDETWQETAEEPTYTLTVQPVESDQPLLGRAQIDIAEKNGESLFSLEVCWQEAGT